MGDATHVDPVERMEPVSPAPMARAVVAKARVAGRVALTMDWRNIVVFCVVFGGRRGGIGMVMREVEVGFGAISSLSSFLGDGQARIY